MPIYPKLPKVDENTEYLSPYNQNGSWKNCGNNNNDIIDK
jgi:hypothetical protein